MPYRIASKMAIRYPQTFRPPGCIQVPARILHRAGNLLRVRPIWPELPDSAVKTFVLTGGLSQSLFMQHLFSVACRLLVPSAEVVCSARQGQLRFQTAVLGALLNSALPRHGNLDKLIQKMCPRKDCPRPTAEAEAALSKLFRDNGLLA